MLGGLHLADLAIKRCAQGECVHLALHFIHHSLLAFGHQVLVAGVQVGAAALQSGVLLGVLQFDLGLLQFVLGLGQINLRHRAAIEAALVAVQVALCGGAHQAGLVGHLGAGGSGQGGIQCGAAGFGFQAGQGGLFLRQLAAQLRAVDHGQLLALLDHVTGDHLQGDRTGRDGVQHRAVGGDDATIGGDIAHQITAGDFGDAQAPAVERAAGAEPAAGYVANAADHHHGGNGGPEPPPPCGLRALGGNLVLGGSVADHLGLRCEGWY
ncbi:hypothetical protein D3C71_1256280 [compost metagenome]